MCGIRRDGEDLPIDEREQCVCVGGGDDYQSERFKYVFQYSTSLKIAKFDSL